MPLLAIADSIRRKQPGTEFLFVGVRHGIEEDVVPHAGYSLRFAASSGMPGSPLSPGMIPFLFKLLTGMIQAFFILLRFRPHRIIASGGYASAPVVFTTALCRFLTLGIWKLPLYIHEQNAAPGRMNLAAARIATMVGVSHASALKHFPASKTSLVGYPVRGDFSHPERQHARQDLGISDQDFYIVAFGGSQGARTLNRAVIDSLPLLSDLPGIRIYHLTGRIRSTGYDAVMDSKERLERLQHVKIRYQQEAYSHDTATHLAACDLAIIRAGSGSLLEICSMGLPAIVIPKANLPGDSQVLNARELYDREAIELLYEEPVLSGEGLVEAVDGKVLAEKIHQLYHSPEKRKKLSRNAKANADLHSAEIIADQVMEFDRHISRESTETEPVQMPASAFPTSPVSLRRQVEKQIGFPWEQAFQHGKITGNELESLTDLDYLHYRGSALLTHSAWQSRNEGVKLIGLTAHKKQLPTLIYLLTDRTPAGQFHRWLGGDYRQVGFIRRNVLAAMVLIGEWNGEVREGVRIALTDPYYEVRIFALRFLRRLENPSDEDCQLASIIRELARDRRQEVRMEALHTFGLLGDPTEAVDLCHEYLLDFHVMVRKGVVRCWQALLNRQDLSLNRDLLDKIEEDSKRFLLPSVSVHPHFPLKEEYAEVLGSLKKRRQE